jgi:hypothetical protein
MEKNNLLKAFTIFFIGILLISLAPSLEFNNTDGEEEGEEKNNTASFTKKVQESENKTIVEDVQKTENKNNITKNNTRIEKSNTSSNTPILENVETPDFEYINIDELTIKNTTQQFQKRKTSNTRTKTNPTNITTNNETQKEAVKVNETKEEERKEELTTHVYYNDGEKEFELKSTQKVLPEIKKTEVIEDSGKEVTISSQEHVLTPITVYSVLETEVQKENIQIFWENEGEYLIDGITFYDENDNGLIDKISWIVPHLSEQIFKIIIGTKTTSSTSDNIIITQVSVPSGIEENPIHFSFNVTYNDTENLNCTLKINGEEKGYGLNYSLNENLENGTHNWEFICFDSSKPQITPAGETGSFSIAEGFSIEQSSELYLLKEWSNQLYNTETIQIQSEIQTNAEVFFDRPEPYANTAPVSATTPLAINLNNDIILGKGTYTINVKYDRIENSILHNFSVANLNLEHPTSGETGEEIVVNLILESPVEKISYLMIDYGDEKNNGPEYLGISRNTIQDTFAHTYTEAGTYQIKAIFKINGNDYEISRYDITITASEDEESPDITLNYPKNEQTIKNETITFDFDINDNIKTENCNFSLYNVTYSSGLWTYNDDTLVYKENKYNIENDDNIEIILTDFSERDYAWEVECVDNSSNYDFETEYFSVSFSNETALKTLNSLSKKENDYDKKELVEELIRNANHFIDNESVWNIDEKNALKDLDIINDVKFYKKRLVQIDQDLKYNLHYIVGADLRDQREKELLAEIEEIKNDLPTSFELIEKYEYVKNGNSFNWENTLQFYLDETKTHSAGSLKDLISSNKELQQQLSVSTIIKKIKIKYIDTEKEIVLIHKKLKLYNNATEKILEIIPEELTKNNEETIFITKSKAIKENELYEITYEDIENDDVIYYIETSNIDKKELESTDTILFTLNIKSTKFMNTISGFLVLNNDSNIQTTDTLVFVFLILVLVIVVLLVISMIKKSFTKKDPNAFKILNLVNEIKKHLKEENINEARENYHKIKEIYPILNNKIKKKIFPQIKKASTEINKKDIKDLIAEYGRAKREKRESDANGLYQKIKSKYSLLPKKYKQKVYKKIINPNSLL